MRALLLIPLLLLAAGCGTTGGSDSKAAVDGPAPMLSDTALGIAYSPLGNKMQFESQPGYLYSVQYRNELDPRAPWKDLPGYSSIRGDGSMKGLVDRPPLREKRRYRLRQRPLRGSGSR